MSKDKAELSAQGDPNKCEDPHPAKLEPLLEQLQATVGLTIKQRSKSIRF